MFEHKSQLVSIRKRSSFGIKHIQFCHHKHDWKTSWFLVINNQFCLFKQEVNAGFKTVSNCGLLVLPSCHNHHPVVLVMKSAIKLNQNCAVLTCIVQKLIWYGDMFCRKYIVNILFPARLLFLLCIKSCFYRFKRLAVQPRQSRRAPFCSSTDRCGAECAPGCKRLSKSPLLLPVIICCSFLNLLLHHATAPLKPLWGQKGTCKKNTRRWNGGTEVSPERKIYQGEEKKRGRKI